MQIRDRYDLVVIGNQLSGLLLAAGAAQLGWKVLVLTESSVPTALYEVPSGRFLGDFAAEPVIGLAPGSAMERFLQSLGLCQSIEELFPQHQPSLQVVAPSFRLTMNFRHADVMREAGRELPWDRARVEKFCRVLSGTEVSRSGFSRLIGQAGLDVSYEGFGALPSTLFGSMAPRDIEYPVYKELVELCERGVRFPIGGRSGLQERLLARILVFGGTIKRNARVEEVTFERGKLAGVVLSSYEGFVRSPRVVGACDVRNFLELIPTEFRPARIREWTAAMKPRFWRLSFSLLVPETAVPEGMGTHVALLRPEAGFDHENFLQLQKFHKDVYGGIPAGHVAIVARALVPFSEEAILPRYIARVLKRSLREIERFAPFLSECGYSVTPDPDRLESDPVFQRYYNFRSLEQVPTLFEVYEEPFGGSARAAVDWGADGLGGVILASRDIRPYHGLVGEIATAIDGLSLLTKERRKA